MDPLIDDAEPARAFIELLKAVVDDLRDARGGSLKRMLRPEHQRDWSEWTKLQLGISEAAFGDLLVELEASAAQVSVAKKDEWDKTTKPQLRAAFIGYLAWWDARKHHRRTGYLTASMRPSRAEKLIESRLATMGISLVHLRDPERFLELVDTHVQRRSQDGEYGLATTTGQALSVLLDDADRYFGQLSDGRLAWMKAYASFQLFFNGLHSGSYSTAETALKQLAAADLTGDRTGRAMHLHAQNLFAERTGKIPDTQRALAALALEPAAGSLPLLKNVERTIKRRATLALVLDGYPLDHKPDGDKTLEHLLIGYRDEAEKIGAMPSLVVDNIGLAEVMLQHGRLRDAQAFHSQAFQAFLNAPTLANERLMQGLLQQLRNADAANKVRHSS